MDQLAKAPVARMEMGNSRGATRGAPPRPQIHQGSSLECHGGAALEKVSGDTSHWLVVLSKALSHTATLLPVHPFARPQDRGPALSGAMKPAGRSL